MRPLLVRTVPSLFGSESNEGCKGCCKDCSLTLGCSMIDSSVGISGIKSKYLMVKQLTGGGFVSESPGLFLQYKT